MRAVLRNRDFRLLWTAGLVSYIGNWSMFAALPLFVFQATDSVWASGLVFTAMYAPLLFGSVIGVFVDRWDRRRTLIIANLAMAALTLPMLVAATGHGLWVAYLVVVGVGLVSQFSYAAENALLPSLVGRQHLLAANSLNSLNDNLARIVGPALGGLLASWTGLTAVVIMNAASYLIAAGLIAAMRTRRSATRAEADDPETAARGWWRQWRSGLGVIFGSQMLATIFAVCAVSMLADSVLSALLAPFVVGEVSAAAWAFGLILALRGVGGLLGGVLTGMVGSRITPALLLGVSLAAVGLLSYVFVNVPVPLVSYLTITAIGVLAIPWLASQQTLVQTHTADGYLGRVFGALGTTNAVTMLVGSVLGAGLAELVGVLPLLNTAATLYTTAGLLALLLLALRPQPTSTRSASSSQRSSRADTSASASRS